MALEVRLEDMIPGLVVLQEHPLHSDLPKCYSESWVLRSASHVVLSVMLQTLPSMRDRVEVVDDWTREGSRRTMLTAS